MTAAVSVSIVAIVTIGGLLHSSLAFVYLVKQDVNLALAALVILGASLIRLGKRDVAAKNPIFIWSVSGLLVGAALVGREVILLGYDLSRDEQLASFDAAVYATGKLAAPLPQLWIPRAQALNTDFMLPVAEQTAWISGYLPMNSAIRGFFEMFDASNLVSPIALLIGAIALIGCVQRIWPGKGSYTTIALLFYFGSGQVLVTSMTTYAMQLHLALNMLWLLLFLQRRTATDLAALVVGFFAVGLHQPLFHPLFAAPILATLLFSKEWKRATFYFLAYCLIGAFWAYWPTITVETTGIPLPGYQQGYASRLQNALLLERPTGLLEMITNLLRFITWQHILLLPLFVIGFSIARQDALFAALATGLVFTVLVMTIILPYQGHGFGYRYLHGFIGSAILLAIHGWDRGIEFKDRWGSLLFRTSLGTFVIIIPLQLFFANAFYSPYAKASENLSDLESDYVVISSRAAPFAIDLVNNDPFLMDRPVRLVQERLDKQSLAKICARNATIVFPGEDFYARIRAYFSLPRMNEEDIDSAILRNESQKRGCVIR